MTPEVFDELLDILRPAIEKQNTNRRPAIPADVRLTVCLRHLTMSMFTNIISNLVSNDLQYLSFQIHKVSVQLHTYIKVVCEADIIILQI